MDERNNDISRQELDYGKLFRVSVVGGFNKQDVLDYIEKTAKKRKKDEERFSEQIKAFENESEGLAAGLQAARADAQEYENSFRSVKAEYDALSEKLKLSDEFMEAVKEELDTVQAKLSETETKLAETEKKYDESIITIAMLKTKANASEKVAELEAKCAALEAALSENNKLAAEVAQVTADAVRIRAEAEEYAASVRIDADEQKEKISGELKLMYERLENAERCVNVELSDLSGRYQAMRKNISSLIEMIR